MDLNENHRKINREIQRLFKNAGPLYSENGTFWILWNPKSALPPTVRFSSQLNAVNAAKSMARQHGESFYVLKAEALADPVQPAPPPPTVKYLGEVVVKRKARRRS